MCCELLFSSFFFARVSKDIAIRPPSRDEDVLIESPAPRQGDEKKKKRVQSSPRSEKKEQKEVCCVNIKGGPSARVPSSDSLQSLRDESEEEKENSKLVAHMWLGLGSEG